MFASEATGLPTGSARRLAGLPLNRNRAASGAGCAGSEPREQGRDSTAANSAGPQARAICDVVEPPEQQVRQRALRPTAPLVVQQAVEHRPGQQ